MTTLTGLEHRHWQAYLDRVSIATAGKHAEVEVAGLPLGAEIEAEWLPLLGITYDPKGDAVDIALENFDHMIYAPREIYVDDGPSGMASMEIIDRDGARHIIQLRDPLVLPPGTMDE